MKSRLLLLAMLSAVSSACGPNPLQIVGRLAFRDDWGCGSPVPSQSVSWADCHAFKRNIDPDTGAAVTRNDFVPNVLRGLPATVELTYITGGTAGEISFRTCGTSTFQADADGVFNIPLSGCGAGISGTIVGRVFLQAPIRFGDQRSYIRSLWRQDESDALLDDLPGVEVSEEHAIERDGIRYAIPVLTFRANITEPESTRGRAGRINIGTQVFLARPTADRFIYMRQVLSAYTTVFALHQRLSESLGNPPSYITRMFPLDESSRIRQYNVWFTDVWARAGGGYMSLYRPDLELFGRDSNGDGTADSSTVVAQFLSSTSVLGHEFGHSIHGSYAGTTSQWDYNFASSMTTPAGDVYSWGHSGLEYQEMGSSLGEGIANTFGQYLLNRCSSFVSGARPLGGADPFSANEFSGDTVCDGTGSNFNGCGFHHVRWHLRTNRGLTEGGSEWTTRLNRLRALTAATPQRFVVSNSEARYGEFGCDLLDSNTNVSHAGLTRNMQYLSNFVYQVGEYLDGNNPAVQLSQYPDTDANPEDVTINMEQLLDALANFCQADGGCTLPTAYGSEYNTQRLKAAGGKLSPQNMGLYLEGKGLLNRTQLLNLLRTNYMEANL